MNNLVWEAVAGATADMGSVQSAADAISGAIAKVKPLLTGQTWTGPAAEAWEGDWSTFYNSVLSCLNSLPSAEASVISGVRQQAEQLAASHQETARAS